MQPLMHCSPTGPRQCNLWVQRGIVAACVVCEHADNSRLLVGGVVGEKFERGKTITSASAMRHLEAESG